jgi:hypothetical protein
MKPSEFLESKTQDFILNINDDYRYMKTGYYVSLHAEILGNRVIPSSENIIDANRTPILLLRAARAGVPTLPFLVTDSVKRIVTQLGFPVVVFAVNPFIHDGYKVASNRSALYRVVNSLGMNYKFAVCAQPFKGEMTTFKSIFGKCNQDHETKTISEKVYALFKIPVCKLHVQRVEKKVYLSGLEPLGRDEISPHDLRTISEETSLISKQGEPLSG